VTGEPDRWAQWLFAGRDAGDPRQRAVVLEHLVPVRDRVLDQAEPLEGATVLDVGCGDGLIGLAALDRVGPRGTVVFTDISDALLEHCRRAVGELGLLERARFAHARAEDLAAIADGSVDVATTRSVLMYVEDKPAAFAALHRVLRPGGRLSAFEPINTLMFPEPPDRFWGYDVRAVAELADGVKAAFAELADPAAAVIRDFDDRDLVSFAEEAGFERIHLECHVDVEPGSDLRVVGLDALLDSAPNPLAPSLRDALATALGPSERETFLAHLERAVAEQRPLRRSAVAYLRAEKLT
jgi:ubiquinone/menaquinone biosynthesis C-methylase UbiE